MTRKRRHRAPRNAQTGMPWAPRPAPRTNAIARPGPAKVGFLPRWTPRHIWTLHLVPGRLDGPPLAVRRRCLRQADVGLDIEVARGKVAHAYTEGLEEHGVCDAPLDCAGGEYGLDVGLRVYDHEPTAEERAAFVARKRIERELRRKPPERVWLACPPLSPGRPYIALSFNGCLSRSVGMLSESRFDYQIQTPTWRDPRTRRHERYVVDYPTIDLLALMTEGPQRTSWLAQDMTVFVYIERPSQEGLERLGREYAEEQARKAKAQRDAEDMFNAFRRAQGEAERQHAERSAALKALGLDAGATRDDVQRAYRQRIASERCHPDQGGDRARFERLTTARDVALRAVAAS